MKIFIGIDNGVTGNIGFIQENGHYEFIKTPVFSQQNYTKAKGNITRIHFKKLMEELSYFKAEEVLVAIERPMINSHRFKASISAARALEATMNVIEHLGFSYMFVDSKSWQSELLPEGTKTTPELKAMSSDIGIRTFPKVQDTILAQGDADGILIAEWLKRFDQGTLRKNYQKP